MPEFLLPPALSDSVRRGQAILFLGSGAARGALHPNGQAAPDGNELRDLLCDRFLGGQLRDKPLVHVAELSKNEAGVGEVQAFVRDQFIAFQPAGFHELIATFRWFSIITTNFDLILERAYEACAEREQALVPILRDGDNFADHFPDQSKVVYIKLHGCISHISDEHLPLILASEEYAKHRRNRHRLFNRLADWGHDRPIIFCGYNISDPNIQQILFDLADLGYQRPTYAVVDPNLDEFTTRYWASKRMFVVHQTFENFIKGLDAAIPRTARTLASLVPKEAGPLEPWIQTHADPSDPLRLYLSAELQQIHKGMATSGADPAKFYSGNAEEWGIYEQQLDIRRRVTDDIILDSFLDDSVGRVTRFFLLKGHAGSGKSVCLRRIAWDIANDYDGLVFWLREGARLDTAAIGELHELTRQRIFIIIDDALRYLAEIRSALEWSRRESVPTTFLVGARTNEWNVYGADLDQETEAEYELRDLTESEIQAFLQKLSQHNALGDLAHKSLEEQLEHFRLSAERQLLVALHDINKQKPFELMVLDEYNNITPPEARLLYLDVCTLHRLGVAVRAGLISRISGISFDAFSSKFFRPLEHVVRTYFDYRNRDNMYRSRHRLIAELVIKQVLSEPVERAAQITRIIRGMDIDFESDEKAFRDIINGHKLGDLFADRQLALRIFDAALESGADPRHVEHQRAVF